VTHDFTEFTSSHAPALVLLEKLGYTYLPPSKALELRGGRKAMPVLAGVLGRQLRRINAIHFKGKTLPFSEANIRRAVQEISQVPFDSLIHTSERVYDLLTLGKSLEQTIDGYVKSHSLRYIDWEKPENNVFHVCDEFEVERMHSSETRRPDIALFVNGLPLAVIECKRPDLKDAVDKGGSQHLRNQRRDEIPEFYAYTQLLLSVAQNAAKYAATGSDAPFWFVWKEENERAQDERLEALIAKPLDKEACARLLSERQGEQRAAMLSVLRSDFRTPNPQDRAIESLLSPKRLLELTYGFVLFDNKVKKVARYQQYFAVQAALDRVTAVKGDSPRRGGIIWHTTGSGKSLTMVMLAKALALDPRISNPKVVIVTDRVDLDEQITKTFKACGKDVVNARTGEHLMRLIKENQAAIITTIIDKFETVAGKRAKDESRNIFVLVDESHRGQYGQSHAKMRIVFPNACYIGFTGTPLLRREKSTAETFGGFIHKYTMNQAVRDGAVRPLRYEGRMSELHGDDKELDKWFERITADLTPEQQADLKRKFRQASALFGAEARVAEIAFDALRHFQEFCQGTGKKAQFAVSSKALALQYKRCFEELGGVSAAVVMSPPDTREGNTSIDESKTPEVQSFWKDMMHRYGDEKTYLSSIIDAFKHADEPEILIVVSKLLTGFDAPRNSVLYLDKTLKEHSILQAIARVNRIYDGKDYGLVVDYRGVFGELHEALDAYAALAREGFDREDVENAILDVKEEISQLASRHANVWELFKGVDKKDLEAMQLALAPEDVRERFYARLRLFSSTLQLALSNAKFLEDAPEKTVQRYKNDLKYFLNLRSAVKQRFGEAVDYSAYERQLKNMVNRHIGADAVKEVVAPVDLFQVEQFEQHLERVEGDAAKADLIASRVKKTVTENMDKDPAFFKRLSEIIQEAISNHRAKRLSDAEYLKKMRGALTTLQRGENRAVPEKLTGKKDAIAYFGVVKDGLAGRIDDEQALSDIALSIEQSIASRKIRDWSTNIDIINEMTNTIEDIFFEAQDKLACSIPLDALDAVIERLITVAKRRELA
jgi:type I restriction enzyme R subunit